MSQSLVLWIHVLCGALVFLAAPIAIVSAKGGPMHRRAGRVFGLAMLGVCGSAFWISIGSNNLFLLLISLLSLHLVISGYRVLYLKKWVPADTIGPTRPGALDKGMAQMTLLGCCALVAWGVLSWEFEPLSPVMMVLGLLGATMALGDMKRFRKQPDDPHHWIYTHAARMLLAATGAVTAVSVTNLDLQPEVMRWLAPLVVGLVATAAWVTLLRKRLSNGATPEDIATVTIAVGGGEDDEEIDRPPF